MVIVAAILCGVLIFFMFVFFMEYSRRSRAALSQRMRYYAGAEGRLEAPPPPEKKFADRFMDFVRSSAKKLQTIRKAEALDLTMQQAGLPILGSEFIIMALIGALITGLVTFFLTLNAFTAFLVALATVLAEWCYIQIRITNRRKAFVNQLGDCLTMVANAMRAGFSFLQAMELISHEMEPPISEEFAKVMRDMNLGTRMEEAMEQMDARVNSPDFSLVVTAVLIQRQVGGNLAQILDTISDTINDRIRMRREVMALTAQGRASGWILAALPFAVAILLNFVNPSYLKPLLDSDIGRMAIAGAIVLEIIGFLVIQRIVDIDV